jgi:predicted dehydrogenase
MSGGAPLRVTVVGVGHWHAARYIASLQRLGERIVAVWDPDPAVAARAATAHGAETHPDLPSVLRRSAPDLIVGMGEHAAMPALIAAMLETSAALVLEKPLGIRAADVAPLVERAERDGRFAAVAFTNRHTPMWEAVDTLAQAGRLGNPCYAHFRILNGSPQRYVRDGVGWMLEPARSGGGSLINLGIHGLDGFRRFAGDRVSVTAAQVRSLAHNLPIEDYALAVLRGAGGTVGTVESGYCYAAMTGGDQEWRLITSNAYIVQRAEVVTVQTLDDGRLQRLPGMPADAAYHLFIADSLRRYRLGMPPIATLRDGLAALELVEQVYQAAGGHHVPAS